MHRVSIQHGKINISTNFTIMNRRIKNKNIIITKYLTRISLLLFLFHRQQLGIAHYKNAAGLWHQLLDKVDSYLQTSCSVMFTYSIEPYANKG
jgi:Glycosyl Hydrolase Family 88